MEAMILPSQFYSPESHRHAAGARRLLAAVLEDAVELCIHGGRGRETREAAEWIWSNDRTRILSFMSICDVLQMNPQLLREFLLLLGVESPASGRQPAIRHPPAGRTRHARANRDAPTARRHLSVAVLRRIGANHRRQTHGGAPGRI